MNSNQFFSTRLQSKIDSLLNQRKATATQTRIGSVEFSSPLLLAPMSSIGKAPFRLLMEDLGAGGTVSELISATGLFYKNEQTHDMLYIDPRERNIGLQLFGDDPEHMNYAAQVAQDYGPKFIDINMGCPVKKVVCKGAGSALLKEPKELGNYFRTIKRGLKLPLTIKIRTGWLQPNADEVLKIAKEEGIDFVAIHGRTREQQYRGQANWEYIEQLAENSPLPLIGNGDLHSPKSVRSRMETTKCQGLMIARGCLRNPFIFLESYSNSESESESVQGNLFTGEDYYEVVQRYATYLTQMSRVERKVYVSLQKMIVWFATGFPFAVKFRTKIFQCKSPDEMLRISEDFFLTLRKETKELQLNDAFMNGGHG